MRASYARRSTTGEVASRPWAVPVSRLITTQAGPSTEPGAKVRVTEPSVTVPPAAVTRTAPGGGTKAELRPVLSWRSICSTLVEPGAAGAETEKLSGICCSEGGPRPAVSVRSVPGKITPSTSTRPRPRTWLRAYAGPSRALAEPGPPEDAPPAAAAAAMTDEAARLSSPPERSRTSAGESTVAVASVTATAALRTSSASAAGRASSAGARRPAASATAPARPTSRRTAGVAEIEGDHGSGLVRASVSESAKDQMRRSAPATSVRPVRLTLR